MTSQVVSTAAGAAMAQGLLNKLDAGAGTARLDVYGAGPTFIFSTNLGDPAGAVVGGSLVLSVPTSSGIAYSGLAPTLAVLYAADGTRLLDLKARLVTDTDDPADPAAVVVQAAAVAAGALLRVVSGSIGFA